MPSQPPSGPGLGIILPEFPLDPAGRWRNVAEVVGRAEAAGASGIWLPDHILWHSKAIDALSTLPALASHATTLSIGTAVLQLPLRDPISVAKTFANTQMMAPGRVVCGVSIGENAEEYERLGRSMKTRGRTIDASLDELRRLWGLRGGTRWMNPAPDPAIPVWVGGRAEVARRRAALKGDGWLPYLCSTRWYARHSAALDEEAAEAGRDPSDIRRAVVCFVDTPEVRSPGRQGAETLRHLFGFDPEPLLGFLLEGPPDDVAGRLVEFHEAGAEEILVVVANDRSQDAFEAINAAYLAARAG